MCGWTGAQLLAEVQGGEDCEGNEDKAKQRQCAEKSIIFGVLERSEDVARRFDDLHDEPIMHAGAFHHNPMDAGDDEPKQPCSQWQGQHTQPYRLPQPAPCEPRRKGTSHQDAGNGSRKKHRCRLARLAHQFTEEARSQRPHGAVSGSPHQPFSSRCPVHRGCCLCVLGFV